MKHPYRWFRSALLLLSMSLGAAVAQEPPHPILSIPGSGSGAGTVLSIWPNEFVYRTNFVPAGVPRGEAYGFGPTVVPGDTGWSWTTNSPNVIVSTPSGTVFPTTTNYMIQTQAVGVLSGKTMNMPYYIRAGSATAKSMVFELINYRKRSQLRSDFNKLAPAYMLSGASHATRNQTYARRIAVALDYWANFFPDYVLTEKNSPSYISVTPSYILSADKQRASDHNGLAHEWADDELLAFDAIYDSPALAQLSVERGYDVREHIKSNLFCNEGDFIVYHVPPEVATDSNLSGPFTVLALVARVLNRPDYIDWMDRYLAITVREKIHRDGTLSEGMGYSIGYINENINAARNTRNYFLSRPADTPSLVAISNRANSYVTTLEFGNDQWETMALPNGQLPSFGDTPFNTYFSARNTGISALLPSYGAVAMGAGSSSSTAVQLHQIFAGDNNHMRSDTTAYQLWAFGNEILGNVRYHNGTPGRNFTEQILAYNAVTIDRSDMSSPSANTHGNGDLTLYEPGNNGLAVTEIDGQRAYANKASRYQRIMMLNTVDLTRPYAIDIFRVSGGTNHDYVLHGSIRFDHTYECSFPLTTNTMTYPMLEGSETWVEPTSSGSSFPYYGFWRNVSSNKAPGNFQITYRDNNNTLNRDLRLWMTDDGNSVVHAGRTPVPSRSNGEPANWWVNGLWRSSTIIRRRALPSPQQNLFVSVIEPMNAGNSTIQSVDRLPVSGSNLDSVALKITFTDGRADTYLVNLRNPVVNGAAGGSATVSTADGQYSLTGRIGAHMDRPAGGSRVWTIDATNFVYAGRALSTPGTRYSGMIAGETRKFVGANNDALVTTTPLPVGTALRNRQLSVNFGALSSNGTNTISELFKIDQVIFTNGNEYHICFTNDHMLEITNGTTTVEQMGPLRRFTTSNSFEIAISAYAGQISPIADLNVPPGQSSGPIAFTFGNLGSTAGSSLQVLARSSNQALVPDGNLAIGGSGTNRTINVTTVAGQTGMSVITVSVTDGVWTNSLSFDVISSDFLLTALPASRTVIAGSNTTYTATLTTSNGFSDLVNLGISGLPAGASASYSPPTLNGPGSSTLTVVASNSIVSGNYTLTLTATSGSLSSTTTVALIVTGVADLRWNGIANGTWDLATTANWFNLDSGLTDTFENGDTVAFDDTPGLQRNVSLNITAQPASMTVNASNNYLFSGSGGIGGTASITKQGAGTLTLSNANSFSGTVTVQSGTVKAGHASALGSSGAGTIVNGTGTLDVNGFSLVAEPVTVSGAGVNGLGSIINTGTNQTSALRNVVLTDDVVFGGSMRWDIRNTGGNATLVTGGNPFGITKKGTNQISLVATAVDFGLMDVDVQEGIFAIQTSTASLSGGFGNPDGTITVRSGAQLNLWALGTTSPLNKFFVFEAGSTLWEDSGTSVISGTITLQGPVFFDIDGGTHLLVSNVISGAGGITMIDSGRLVLSGANTYTGDTLLNAGTLLLVGEGYISESANITIAGGAALDVSQRTGGRMLLGLGGTLSGNGSVQGSLTVVPESTISPGTSIGALTVTNELKLEGTALIELNKGASTNDVIRGMASVVYGGTLSLTNLSGTLAAGDSFKIFYATNYSGVFSNITPAIPGIGLGWNTNGLANGTLFVVAAATPQPQVSSVVHEGSNLVLTGSNGVPGWTYYVLASPDLSAPLSSWTRIATNVFENNGAFNLTNAVNPGEPQLFYRLMLE